MNIGMITDAEARIRPHIRRTPLLNSPFLDAIAGRRLWVKAECLQHTGSFKARGAWSAISATPDGAGILAYSSGNHAQGVARAGSAMGRETVVVMPADAPQIKIDNTRALGAEVVLYDRPGGENREEIGAALAAERGLTLVKPYDDPQVIAGQGTAGLEIAEQAAEVGVTTADVVVCCGGGGLSAGIALALEAQAPGLRLRTAEPDGFDDVLRSLASGGRATNNRLSGSIADAILTPAPGEVTWPILHRLAGPGLSVPDVDLLRAMRLAFERLKIVVEPGGAAALAAGLFQPEAFEGDDLIVVATGGNVDAPMFQKALSTPLGETQ